MGIDSSILITLCDWEKVPKPEQTRAFIKDLLIKGIADLDRFIEPFTSHSGISHEFDASLNPKAKAEMIDFIIRTQYDKSPKIYAPTLYMTDSFHQEMNEALQTTQVTSEIRCYSFFESADTSGMTYEILLNFNDPNFDESLRKLIQEGLIDIRIYKNYTIHTGKVSVIKRKNEEFFVEPSEIENYTIYDDDDHEGIKAAYERGDELFYLSDTGYGYVFDMKSDYRRIDYDINELDFKIFSETNAYNEAVYVAMAYEGAFVIDIPLRNDVVSPEKYRLFLDSEPCQKLVECVELAFGQAAYVTSDFSRF